MHVLKTHLRSVPPRRIKPCRGRQNSSMLLFARRFEEAAGRDGYGGGASATNRRKDNPDACLVLHEIWDKLRKTVEQQADLRNIN